MKYYILILLQFPFFTKAQQPLDFLRKAMAANGPWEKINALEYRANRYNYNPWQSYHFDQPVIEKDMLEMYVDRRNKRFHDHTTRHYPGGYVFNFVGIGKDSAYYEYDVTGSRTGKQLLKSGADQYNSNYHDLLSGFPYWILKETLYSGDTLQLKKAGSKVILYRHTGTGIQELSIDAQTKLLRKYITNGTTWYFDAYRTIDGYQVPGKIKQELSTGQVLTDHLVTFRTLKMISPSLFDLPGGYRQEEITRKPLLAKEIEKDIFLVEKVDDDRNLIFINMEDYIVLTEAPVSEETVASVLKLIHKTLPGKRVKYVHLSHFHKDHIAGIRRLIEEGVSIICTPSLEKPVRKIAEGTTPTFVFFSGHKMVSDSSHRIDLFEIPNSHVDGLSFLYLPNESIIYESDLLSVPEDGTLTPAIKVSEEFYNFIRKTNLSYKRIIGHHGLPDITPGLFEKIRFAER